MLVLEKRSSANWPPMFSELIAFYKFLITRSDTSFVVAAKKFQSMTVPRVRTKTLTINTLTHNIIWLNRHSPSSRLT